MNKLNKILSGVLAVQIAIFALAYLVGGSKGQGRSVPEPLLPGMAVDQITKLVIEQDKDSVEIARRDGKWVIANAQDYPADAEKVQKKLGELVALQSSHIVAKGKEHHAKLEVAPDKFRRKVTLETGTAKQVLWIGGRSAGFTNFRIGDADLVRAVDEFNEWDLAARPRDWLDKKYLPFEPQKIAVVELKRAEDVIKVERVAQDAWTINGKPIDRAKADALLDQIAKIEPSGVIGKVSDPAVQKMFDAGQEPMTVTLAIAADPLPATAQPTPPSAPPAEGQPPTPPPAPPARPQVKDIKVVHIVKDPEKTNLVRVYAEDGAYAIEVDSWRIEKLRSTKADGLLAN